MPTSRSSLHQKKLKCLCVSAPNAPPVGPRRERSLDPWSHPPLAAAAAAENLNNLESCLFDTVATNFRMQLPEC